MMSENSKSVLYLCVKTKGEFPEKVLRWRVSSKQLGEYVREYACVFVLPFSGKAFIAAQRLNIWSFNKQILNFNLNVYMCYQE